METYEVFTENYSKIYQADGILSAMRMHYDRSQEEIVAVTIADRPDLLRKLTPQHPSDSAGEEVYVECGKNDGYEFWTDPGNAQPIRYFKKLTRPTESAGEEVYIECEMGESAKLILHDFTQKDQYGLRPKITYLKKLTRPTVSEGAIEWAFKDNAKFQLADHTKLMNFEEFKAAIKELLNR